MKLDWLRADIASARRASALLVLLLACSMLANVTLAAFAMHMAGRERVVVVPPSINKTFWVESERHFAEIRPPCLRRLLRHLSSVDYFA